MKKLDTSEFIKKARLVHYDKFDYSAVVYKTNKIKIKIICTLCSHEFTQTPNNHLHGFGCPKCAGTNKQTTAEFIKKAQIYHGSKYDYSMVVYKNNKTKVKIICPVHGMFEQLAIYHKQGNGCPKCGVLKSIYDRSNTTSSFIEKAELIHPDKYIYDSVIYIHNRVKVKIICPVHGMFEQAPNNHLRGQGCPWCISHIHISKAEQELFDYVKTLVQNAAQSNRSIINPLELDIVCPDQNIAIEYNGLYYHASQFKDNNYHQQKTKLCKDNGYRLIHIWEDDWINRKPTVKNFLEGALTNNSVSIFGRKTKLIDLRKEDAKIFLNKYHIQGSVGATKHIGVYYTDCLVGVCSFKNQGGNWDLSRYAVKHGYRVLGGLGKCVQYFLRNTEDIKSLKSFCDLAMYLGGSYEKAGFEKMKILAPDYRYVVGLERKHKFGFRHVHLRQMLDFDYNPSETELENTTRNGLYRIYDCGKIKYTYPIK